MWLRNKSLKDSITLTIYYKTYFIQINLYPKLTNDVKYMTPMISNTYTCEQLILVINFT